MAQAVIGAAIKVHRQLGPGLLESAYVECLCRELTLRGIPFERERALPVEYKGVRLECGYRLDLLVAGVVVVEVKSVEALAPVHEAQLKFMLRLPVAVIGAREAQRYCGRYCFSVRTAGDSLILDFSSNTEEYEDWVETGGVMASLAPVRAELLRGDRRALYLGWLLRVQEEELDRDDVEPLVPDGLNALSAPLSRLAEFLRIDEDLLAVAAERSAAESDTDAGLSEWVSALPAREKDRLLLDIIKGHDTHLGAKLLAQFRSTRKAKTEDELPSERQGRTVGELLDAAARHREAREREEARRAAEARARKEAEQAKARAAYLDELSTRQEAVWREVERLIAARQPKAYDEAVALLVDLRDLAERTTVSQQFGSRLASLTERYSNRPSLLSRLKKAGLGQ